MGRRTRTSNNTPNPSSSHSCTTTLPSSPTHSFSSSSSSSSSSDFEFTISISPRKTSTLLCPADELFYKGQLLPLHLSPRISMVRTLLLSSSSTTAPRHSTASTTSTSSSSTSSSFTNDCDSSRPSSVTDDENNFVNRHNATINNAFHCNKKTTTTTTAATTATNNNNNKYFLFSRFSSVFGKNRVETHESVSVSVSEPSRSVKKMGSTAKEVIRKYLNKVKKPLLFSHKHKDHQKTTQVSSSSLFASSKKVAKRSAKETQNAPPPPPSSSSSSSFSCLKKETTEINESALVSSSLHSSFSGNLNYPRRKSTYVSSCPSSMRSSPTHSGVLSAAGKLVGGFSYADTSTMEELQNAIQGAIAHCKNSLAQNKDYGAVCFRI